MNSPVSAWFLLHIPLLGGAYLLLGVASLAGLAFIVQERLIKTRPSLAVAWQAPSLETLERFIYRLILLAFPLLSAGILIGGLWAIQARGRFWGWDPSEMFTLVTWLIYSSYLILRWTLGWRGRKSTYVALAGFGLALATLAVLVFFSPLHQTGRGM
jgi:ABC-type transport system involved in cytochrome c biogenesis permease subunit